MTQLITNLALSRSTMADTQATLSRLATYEQQLSSGHTINQVSDNPSGARQALQYQAQTSQIATDLANITNASALSSAADSTLGQMSTLMDQAQQIAVQGANGTETPASLTALSQNVSAILSQMVDLANTSQAGQYLFSGTAVTTQPFTLASDGSAVSYQGTLATPTTQIGTATTIPIGQNGYQVFQSGTNVFATLIQLRNALASNQPSTVNTLIDQVSAAASQISNAQGAIGGTEQQLTTAHNQLQAAQTTVQGLLSSDEDTDLPSAISQMQLTEVALQAGLQASAQILKPSLLNYLQ